MCIIVVESEEISQDMAASYLQNAHTDGLTNEELTLEDGVIPVEEDGRLHYFLQQNNIPYEEKSYGNSRFILVKENVYDQFTAVRSSLNGIVAVNPAVLCFIAERRIKKFEILANKLIQFDSIMYESFIQWCQDISK